jgi:signal transduction histidine kinase
LVVRSTVEDRHDGPWAVVAVEDAGVGFREVEAARLFEAFYTTKPGGLGMGLSISRSIVDGHRGRLWATPNAGHGATFHFALPGMRSAPGTRDSPSEVAQPHQGRVDGSRPAH